MAENNPSVIAADFSAKTIFVSIMAGGIAGTSIDAVLFPLDSIKTRLQASSKKGTNFVEKASQISKYRGLAATMAASFPCAATFWLSYEYFKYVIRKNHFLGVYLNVHVQHIFASSLAETCQALVRCPFEVIKQNM